MLTIRQAELHELPHATALDDAANQLFTEHGLLFNLADDHPFVIAERESWRAALLEGTLFWAVLGGRIVGFYAFNRLGEARLAHLEQLAVPPEFGRRGIGTALIEHCAALARERNADALWLTTYAHLPWNAPYYARHGFERVADRDCSPELQAVLLTQRRYLPDPEQRTAMRRQLR